MWAIVIQPLRHAPNPGFVLLDQLNVSPSHRRIRSDSIAVRGYEEMLDHAVSTEQLDATQEQVWIRRETLTDGICQVEPRRTIVTVAGLFIRLEQRHEILNQQREIKRIGAARAENQG